MRQLLTYTALFATLHFQAVAQENIFKQITGTQDTRADAPAAASLAAKSYLAQQNYQVARPAVAPGKSVAVAHRTAADADSPRMEIQRGRAHRPAAAPSVPGAARVLSPGASASYDFPPVDVATLYTGDYGYAVTVPDNATAFTVTIRTTTAKADVDLFVRYGTAPALENGHLTTDWSSSGPTGDESVTISSSTSPSLKGGTYYIAFGVFTTGVEVTGTVSTSVTVPSGGSGSGSSSHTLVSGTPAALNLPAADVGTLYCGDYGYQINVPSGVSKMDIAVAPVPSNVSLTIYARAGQDIDLSNGRAVADYTSASGARTLSITPSSGSTLTPGTYYIGFGLFTTGVAVTGTVTATVTGGSSTPSDPGPSSPTALTSGQAETINLPAVVGPTLFFGGYAYKIDVPASATALRINLNSLTNGADLDLYVRYGSQPAFTNGAIVADYKSMTSGGTESITINSSSSPALKAGTYYIAYGLFTLNTVVKASLTATIDSTPVVTSQTLVDSSFTLPAVDSGTLFHGDYSYAITVPANAKRLDVTLTTDTPGADVDLFLRAGQDTAVSSGTVVCDFSSNGPTGNEAIAVTTSSNPPLKSGTWYISFGLFTTGKSVNSHIKAVVSF